MIAAMTWTFNIMLERKKESKKRVIFPLICCMNKLLRDTNLNFHEIANKKIICCNFMKKWLVSPKHKKNYVFLWKRLLTPILFYPILNAIYALTRKIKWCPTQITLLLNKEPYEWNKCMDSLEIWAVLRAIGLTSE